MKSLEVTDHRGRMVRRDRQMPDAETRAFLRQQSQAHVGTADAAGWPYVVALMYVYACHSIRSGTGDCYGKDQRWIASMTLPWVEGSKSLTHRAQTVTE